MEPDDEKESPTEGMLEADGKELLEVPESEPVLEEEVTEPTPPKMPRVLALDALRGLAIMGMALSGFVPNNLPAWMYHAQDPPPLHETNVLIFGISWVDCVFPFFLFSMGAAIPIAIRRRIEKGATTKDIVFWLLERGLLLAAFAYAGQHLRPLILAKVPDNSTWWIVLLGFTLLVLMFMRWPGKVPVAVRRTLTVVGWIGAIALIGSRAYPSDTVGFANYRVDIILMVLANVAVSGGLVWLLTRQAPLVRLGVFMAVLMVFLSKDMGGIGQSVWDYTPIQHFQTGHWPNLFDFSGWQYHRFVPLPYHFEYHKYLLIVIPGTFCGDLYSATFAEREPVWKAWRTIPFALLAVGMTAVAVTGLLAREVTATALALGAMSVVSLLLLMKPSSPLEVRIRRFAEFGTAFVLFGLLAEPIGGGIRKAAPTASYYLLTTGLAFFFLAGLTVLIDVFKKGRWLRTTVDLGQNPILGYVIITNLVPAIFGLLAVNEFAARYTDNQWQLAIVGLVETVSVAYITAIFTRNKLFLRA